MTQPSGAALQGSSGNNEIGTPRWLFERLNDAFQFNYDAFASHENALCDTYSTVEGTFTSGGNPLYGLAGKQNALTLPWRGQRVFMNPPYGRKQQGQTGVEECVEKAVAERNSAAIIVALIKVDTSTRWFQLLMQHAHIDYLSKRVKYEGQTQGATFASCVAILRRDWLD